MQWRVLRADRLAAAREGKRIRSALERALALDPTLHDANFGIGLYHYYADVAPAAAKILRWLLLLPGGNRVQGLREMLEARDQGELLSGEADFQLHWLYLWYEQQPDRALALLAATRSRAIRPIRSSSSASPKCSTNIFTIIPPARRRGRRCSRERRPAGRAPQASRK